LNKVDLPTLGRPTMPHFKLMKISLEINVPIAPSSRMSASLKCRQSLWRDQQANPKSGWGKAV
jgi:hypothetical protein